MSASVSEPCGDTDRSTRLDISTLEDETPPGVYVITVSDNESSRSFTLEVRDPTPPPTTTMSTTTTTTTTTTLPTTTTSAAPLPTSSPPETTTTTLGASVRFPSVADLIAAGLPDEGVFLPLNGNHFADCLPLVVACRDPSSDIVLLPARGTEIAWHPTTDDLPEIIDTGALALRAVGTVPDDPTGTDYQLPVLDLDDDGPTRGLLRGINDVGELITPTRGVGARAPIAVGEHEGGPDTPRRTAVANEPPFGAPVIRTSSTLSEASPALVVAGSTNAVVFLLRADPSWGLNQQLLPLLGTDRVPYLVRGSTGPAGLFIALPDDLQIPAPENTFSGGEVGRGGPARGRVFVALVAANMLVLGIAVASAVRRARARRAPA